MGWVPTLALLAPLTVFGGAALAAAGGHRRLPLRWVALVLAPSTALFLTIAVLLLVALGGGGSLVLFDGTISLLAIDAISASVALLVSFVGWVVMRYARTYLAGEPNAGRFHALMLATLGSAVLLILAGNLVVVAGCLVAIGWSLRRLLLTYPQRREAQRAAAKFALVWRAADLAMIGAALLLWLACGSVDLVRLGALADGSLSPAGHVGVVLLVLAMLMKSACLPLHGWLTEVMEAPTPVSALLHAGVINAGGYVLIRTADLVQQAPWTMAILVMIGGMTALYGAVVMLTQSAVKTGLAWSTVSQMGFMLFQCGLGLWSLALLHIVAHSLYKAHGFLNAGEAIKAINRSRRLGPVAAPGPGAVGRAFAVALGLYLVLAVASLMVFGPKPAQAVALGAILIFGIAYLMAQGLADAAPRALARLTASSAGLAAIAYFTFHGLAEMVWGHELPEPPAPGALEWALICLALVTFGIVAVAQSLFPRWAHHPTTAGLRVHLANGLYLNALLDRWIGGFSTQAKAGKTGGYDVQ